MPLQHPILNRFIIKNYTIPFKEKVYNNKHSSKNEIDIYAVTCYFLQKGVVMAQTAKERVRRYRERRKAMGMKELRMWVPDTKLDRVKEEAKRQSILASQAEEDEEVMDWIEEVMDTEGWE